MESLEFSAYSIIISSTNSGVFVFSFPVWLSFTFFLPTWFARPSNIMLNKYEKSGHPCLVSHLRGKASWPLTIDNDAICNINT